MSVSGLRIERGEAVDLVGRVAQLDEQELVIGGIAGRVEAVALAVRLIFPAPRAGPLCPAVAAGRARNHRLLFL